VAASVRHRARAQRVGSALVALLLALALLTLNFGVIDLVDGFTGFVDQQRNPVLDVGWGALFGIVLPIGLLSQVRHPERRIAGLQQCALVALALGVAGVVGGAWGYLVVAGGLGGTVALLVSLHPARHTFLRRGRVVWPLVLLASAAIAPCLVYAQRMASAGRRHLPPADAVSNGLHHWSVLAALALSVFLLAGLAGLGTAGWRIPSWSAALASLAWGVSCLRYPDAAGGEGRAWGLAALIWALAVVAVTETEARRVRRSLPTGAAGTAALDEAAAAFLR
jgi:hypothetical protein